MDDIPPPAIRCFLLIFDLNMKDLVNFKKLSSFESLWLAVSARNIVCFFFLISCVRLKTGRLREMFNVKIWYHALCNICSTSHFGSAENILHTHTSWKSICTQRGWWKFTWVMLVAWWSNGSKTDSHIRKIAVTRILSTLHCQSLLNSIRIYMYVMTIYIYILTEHTCL